MTLRPILFVQHDKLAAKAQPYQEFVAGLWEQSFGALAKGATSMGRTHPRNQNRVSGPPTQLCE